MWDLSKVQTSCGYGVPLLSASPSSPPSPSAANGESAATVPELKDRDTLGHWASKMVAKDELRQYQKRSNAYSLDGLPGLKVAMRDQGHSVAWGRVKSWRRRISVQRETLSVGISVGASLVLLIQWLIRMLG